MRGFLRNRTENSEADGLETGRLADQDIAHGCSMVAWGRVVLEKNSKNSYG